MKYAVIAAGEGSRLSHEGIDIPKPLVKVGDERLIDRLIRIFMAHEAEEIVVICNDKTTAVRDHLYNLAQNGLNGKDLPLQVVVKSTPSSMHSLYEMRKYLLDSPFCLTTVDTIFKESEFKQYLEEYDNAITGGVDAWMGVTTYVDDEKPLYVETNEKMRVTGFLDNNNGNCRYISGGIYGLNFRALATLEVCIERGERRMRNFQRALIADGLDVRAYAFGQILDIDHAVDIEKAKGFLLQGTL